MSRVVYALLLIGNSAVLGFLVAVVSGTFLLSGEAAQGAGLYWAFSLPATLVIAILLAFRTFPAYTSRPSFERRVTLHLVCSLAAAAAGLGVTAVLWSLYVALAS